MGFPVRTEPLCHNRFLILVYLCYLIFQFVSHDEISKHDQGPTEHSTVIAKGPHTLKRKTILRSHPPLYSALGSVRRGERSLEAGPEREDNVEEVPQMGILIAIMLLVVVMVVS